MSFDVLAPHYRWMERVLAGNKLQRCRTFFLEQVIDRQNVLIVGEGNGRFLVECRRALNTARITCVDASARMLTLARQRIEDNGLSATHIDFVQADVLAWTPPARRFDLIVTHFFLDCFGPEQLKRVVELLAGAAKPEAAWLLADFQVPARGWRRQRARLIHQVMYAFFRLVTRIPARRLSAPDPFLNALGFTLRCRSESDWGLLHTDLWARNGPVAAKKSFNHRSTPQ